MPASSKIDSRSQITANAALMKVKLAERIHFVTQLFPKTYVTVQVPTELLEQAPPSEARTLPSLDVPAEVAAARSGRSISSAPSWPARPRPQALTRRRSA